MEEVTVGNTLDWLPVESTEREEKLAESRRDPRFPCSPEKGKGEM